MAFRYGDPAKDDVMGDCAITEDGRFMVGTFGTGSAMNRPNTINDIQN